MNTHQNIASVSLQELSELLEGVKLYSPHADLKLIENAYWFAAKAHKDQKRRSGEAYIIHPFAVAKILTKVFADQDTIITALLHDTVEDTDVSLEDITREFGKTVSLLVDGVTKLTKIKSQSYEKQAAENFRKFILALTKDIRVLLVKLADRLHNMRTIEHVRSIDKRNTVALETVEIYAPLAQMVGVTIISSELEDLAFQTLNPTAYEVIIKRLKEIDKQLSISLADIIEQIKQLLSQYKIKASIEYRVKTPFSISQKMQSKKLAFEDLADIYAIRVIVDETATCYQVLGIIHQKWHMIHHEFDDYISSPKPNGYQSIHTGVLALSLHNGKRQRLEIQIRTQNMHQIAQSGVASHSSYKSNQGDKDISSERRKSYNWASKFLDILQTSNDVNEAFKYAKAELYQDQVFCFTPKGLIISLPVGASSLDFAYAVHSNIGNNCMGVKINNIIMPLRTRLKNGDLVTIIRSNEAPIPPFWESMVVTGKAKSALKKRQRLIQREEKIKLGRIMLEDFMAIYELEITNKSFRPAITYFKVKDIDELFLQIGEQLITAKNVMRKCFPAISQTKNLLSNIPQKGHNLPIIGLEASVKALLANCCNPVPGERIVAINEKDEGVMVHSIFCNKLEDYEKSHRWYDVSWDDDKYENKGVLTKIILEMSNKVGVLSEITQMTNRYNVDIINIRLEHKNEMFVDGVFDIFVKDIQHLNNLLIGLRTIVSIISVLRPVEQIG